MIGIKRVLLRKEYFESDAEKASKRNIEFESIHYFYQNVLKEASNEIKCR